MYGPTETTIWSTCQRVEATGAVRIGRPIANTVVRVLDDALHPVPVGAPGELFIGGAGLALGYHGREELTAERFVADPARAGEILYRTGDAARWLADGTLEHLGRLDDQVKVRGFRVEPGEIESTIVESGIGRQAAVVVRSIGGGDDRLVAFVVSDGELPAAESLRQRLSAWLPDYMVPNHWIRIDTLPRTPNGKLDRRALAASPVEAPVASTRDAAPATATEQRVARVFAEVLHADAVAADADFFDLGGHSILAMRVIARLREQGAAALSLRDLFRGPTVARLAARIDELTMPVTHDTGDTEPQRVELVF
jgi:aryl carrier-like protein